VRRIVARSTLFSALSWALLFALPARADTQTIKLATLAPDGSSWMKPFNNWKAAIEKGTGGAVKVKFYAGGVAGEERDVVRKMRLGQMTGAAITAVGLGLIQPDVRVLEIPFLFKDEAQLDQVRAALAADFRKSFEAQGYELLAWGDVGPVRLFTNIPLREKADLAKVKMWIWNDDPLLGKVFQHLGMNAVGLGVTDVLPSLQTGVINACYGSPVAAVAFQWHSKVKYVTSLVMSQAVGAVVLTKKLWEALSAEQRQVVEDASKTMASELTAVVRADNERSLQSMKAQGIELVPTPEPLASEIRAQARAAALEMDGKLYGKEFRERVEKMVAGKK
jgi:TRAP-type C4-dicarboxylate transport system substrate-binding protein